VILTIVLEILLIKEFFFLNGKFYIENHSFTLLGVFDLHDNFCYTLNRTNGQGTGEKLNFLSLAEARFSASVLKNIYIYRKRQFVQYLK
jgi:hypothetical protein